MPWSALSGSPGSRTLRAARTPTGEDRARFIPARVTDRSLSRAKPRKDLTMAFDAYDRSLDLIRAVPLAKLATCDPDLTRQLRRALQSVTQNIAEANRRAGKDRK